MKIKKSIIFLMLIIATLVFAAGCGSNNTAGSGSTKKSAVKSSDVKGTVFKFYDKVEIGEAKTDVDKALAVTPEQVEEVENTYSYTDSNGYGVSVLYDSSSKAMCKTVLYNSHSDIASLFKKSFTQDQSNKITNDMTYAQVVKLLGDDGVEVVKSQLKGETQPNLTRRWANKDGSCIQINFSTDDKVQYAMFYSGE